MKRLAVVAVFVGLGACSERNDSGDQQTLSDDAPSNAAPADGWRREQTSWALQAVDGQHLTIVVAVLGDPDCERFDGTEVTEDAGAVEVRAFVSVRVPAEDEELICEASAVLEPTAVELAQRLAARQLSGCHTSRPVEEVLARTECTDIEAQT